MRFARRHPWSLPLLDAATGFARPGALLRKKILLATAVLEATPDHVEFFLRPPRSKAMTFMGVGAHGATALAKIGLGLPLLLVLRRS